MILDRQDLLATAQIAEPLVIRGVRCHGGLDADGRYVSPRNRYRPEAIRAWQAQFEKRYRRPVRSASQEQLPAHVPNVAQGRLLVRHGLLEPISRYLTRIAQAESYGGMIRSPIIDLQRFFEEDISGTATAHLLEGLLESHARDEAGHGQEAGHARMWLLVRDIGLGCQPQLDSRAPTRIASAPEGQGSLEERKRARRLCPELDPDLDLLLHRLTNVLCVELAAYGQFAWAEAVLTGSPELPDGPEAAGIVRYILQDEEPHVGYLLTVLSEIEQWSVIGEGGARLAGRSIVAAHWNQAFAGARLALTRSRPDAFRLDVEEEFARGGQPRSLLLDFFDLGFVRPGGTRA